MADKLKPCPFCGGEAHLQPFMGYWTVGCTDCFGAVVGKIETKEEAIEAWNKRSDWHTGTPTEEGWYVIKTKHGSLFLVQKNSHGFWIEDKFGYEALVPTEGYIVAWMPIEPYKED